MINVPAAATLSATSADDEDNDCRVAAARVYHLSLPERVM